MTSLRLRLMLQEAEQRLGDAQVLSDARPAGERSDSSHLLTLLGVELLLKLIHERVLGTVAWGHDISKIFSALPSSIQSEILTTAHERIGPSALVSDHSAVLADWGKNFVALRYPYEKYDGLTEAQYEELGAQWIKDGSPLERATFRYHPSELFAFVHALRLFASRA